MSKIIIKTKTDTEEKFGYIKAKKSIFHKLGIIPFIKNKVYKFVLNNDKQDTIYSSTDYYTLALDIGSRKEFTKFVNQNFTKCPKPTYEIETIINPKEYKFCILDGVIVDINFDTVLYTTKMDNGNHNRNLYVNQYSTFLGILQKPVQDTTIKESDYILKTKIDVLKELYGDFEVENPSSYDLVQEGFCINGWYIRNQTVRQYDFNEIFYYNGEKYLSRCDVIPRLLANSCSIKNCFKTKKEAIKKLLLNLE